MALILQKLNIERIIVMTKKFNSELFRFALFPNYESAITFLADTLADRETWNFSDNALQCNQHKTSFSPHF